MNIVSIVSFSNEIIEISNATNKEYNLRLENIVSDMISTKIKIITSQNSGLSLKTKLLKDLEKSETWKSLNDSFPGCEILDIIHKNGI